MGTDVSGRVSSADGRSGVFTQQTKRPNLFYVSTSWGDSRWTTGFNGRSAWQNDGPDGLRTLNGQAASRVRAEAGYSNDHLMVAAKVSPVSVTGRDEVRGHPVIVVIAVTPDGLKRTLFFDANSYLLVKDEQQTDAGLDERFFDEYRPIDRVMEPHRIEWHRNGETLRIAVERVAPLDGRLFDYPVSPTEPTLDIGAVLAAVGRNEEKNESLRAPYAWAETSTSRKIDQQGRVAEEKVTAFDVFSSGRPADSETAQEKRPGVD